MKRLLLPALVLMLVPTAGAAPVRAVATPAPVRSVTAPAPVTALAFDASRIAYATGFSPGDCNRVYVWNLATRGVSKLGRKTHCEQTSTGNAVESLSIAGPRVLWVHYAGGNLRDWSLWTATTTRPAPLLLRFATRDVDAPPPILVGEGDSTSLGGILPYALDRLVIALRVNGSRRFAWTAPARVTALAASGEELAVASRGGVVTVLDAAGRVRRTETFAGEVTALRIAGTGIVALVGRRLVLRRGGESSWLLPAGARLEDATTTAAFYVTGGQVRRLRFVNGAQRLLGLGSDVRVESPRFSRAAGRRVTAEPLP
jgi:hypothetical protein